LNFTAQFVKFRTEQEQTFTKERHENNPDRDRKGECWLLAPPRLTNGPPSAKFCLLDLTSSYATDNRSAGKRYNFPSMSQTKYN